MTAQGQKEREFAFSTSDFEFLAKLVHGQTGIVLGDHKRDMVYGRLARRLRQLGIADFRSYCDLIQSEQGVAEMGNLVNAITTNLTSFFRETHHFEHLANDVLKPMSLQHGPRKLRIWSAGCSSGAEPYSIAMTMHKSLPNLGAWDAKVLATDIDTNMLQTGRNARYSMEQYDKIPAAYRDLADDTGNDQMLVSPKVQQLVSFKQLNLLGSWPMKGPFDVIFCRNVVIYFDKDTQRTLFKRYAKLLKPNGWLYIGHSENLFNVSDDFKLVGRTIYRKASDT